MILAVDTETTGTDFWHGCRPFMVTACDGESNYIFEGEVNPYNRAEVYWEPEELQEVQELLDSADSLIFHNTKFDMRALQFNGIEIDHLWSKVEDTILASHALCSGESHALKYLSFKYLGYYNDGEKELEDAVKKARQTAPSDYDLAKKGHPCFPGIKGQKTKWYKMDYWLAMEACRKYATVDVEMTYLLWKVFQPALKKEGLWRQYLTRRKLLLIAYEAENYGYNYYTELVDDEVAKLEEECENLRLKIQTENHYSYRLDLSKTESLKFLFHEKLGLEPKFFTDTGAPSMNKQAVDAYIEDNPQIQSLEDYKNHKVRKTRVSDLKTFREWVCPDGKLHSNWFLTGTRETRQSITDPALQTIGKAIRHTFGPPPGYCWLDFDLVNIEMRRWVYLVGNQELIDVFEKGGSVHLLVASIIHADLWEQYPGEKFKKQFVEDWYQWTKNGNFSIIYGATRNKADLTYKKPGSYDKIIYRFPEVAAFTQACIDEVWKHFDWYDAPFVIIDGGYRLEVPLDDIFKAVNYKVQGSAGWIMNEAMIEVSNNREYLDNECQMINQVHDSLVIELPLRCLSAKVVNSIQEAIEAPGFKYMPTNAASVDILTHYDHPGIAIEKDETGRITELEEIPF